MTVIKMPDAYRHIFKFKFIKSRTTKVVTNTAITITQHDTLR